MNKRAWTALRVALLLASGLLCLIGLILLHDAYNYSQLNFNPEGRYYDSEHAVVLHQQSVPFNFFYATVFLVPGMALGFAVIRRIVQARHANILPIETTAQQASAINRADAVNIVAQWTLSQTPQSELADQLKTMANLEDWSDSPGWDDLHGSIKAEFREHQLKHPVTDARYLPVLMIWQRHELAGVSNSYLLEKLAVTGHSAQSIVGQPKSLVACPCCGHKTLDARGEFEICTVCWWEDDSLDNDRAEQHSGPNYMSLAEGRINYLQHGLFDARHDDLWDFKKPEAMFERGRVFTFENGILSEPAADWSLAYELPNPSSQTDHPSGAESE